MMRHAKTLSSGVICRDVFMYSSHPHAVLTAEGAILVVFNQTRRRPFILHPPHDPGYRNLISRSSDGGESWTPPEVVPNYEFHGTECASLTTLSNGTILLNQWTFRWYPLGLARNSRAAESELYFPETFVRELIESGELSTGKEIEASPSAFTPWARGHGDSWVHSSADNGASFSKTAKVDTGPFHGGYGMRGILELPDGELLLPLNDIPEYRTVFMVRSRDGGADWREPTLIAREAGHLFTEPAMALNIGGEIVTLMRDDAARVMHSCRSSDGGRTWSAPVSTGIDGYPPHLLVLSDHRILCTYDRRQPDFSIRAVLSEDGGMSWLAADPVCIRGELPNRDLGYPATIELRDRSLFTVYYCQDRDGVTGIEFTRWQL